MSAGPVSIGDVTTEDVYHTVARDPDALPGIYLDHIAATTTGLSVTLCDELDRSATFTLTVAIAQHQTHDASDPLLAERYGNLDRLLQEAPRC